MVGGFRSTLSNPEMTKAKKEKKKTLEKMPTEK